MDNNSSFGDQAIAVIGMAGRFPGARNLTEFWQNLRRGVESVQKFSEEEIRAAGVDPSVMNHPNYVRSGNTVEDADCFDAAFFGFTPREAEITDPQHRVFLETAWEALEDAGYDPGRYAGAIGVYAGVSMNTYIFSNLLKNPELLASMGGYQTMLGNDKDFLPTRVSYKLNLKGPSMSIQTACSTSLVAVQVACQALLGKQCDMALAGGVSLGFPQKAGYLYQDGMILSPDGHCRPFDAKGAGVFGGSGAGIVVLKRLQDALRDGDAIHAVIRGAAINNDGSAKVGYTAPSVDGQAEVITAAQAMAQIEPETIRYVEAHGTGTPLGDPIEMAALTKAFRMRTEKKQFCAIGSVKSNIGHLDAAAGIAGLIKTALALRHKELPPSLNFESPNPQIDFDNSPFFVNTQLSDWSSDGLPRRAGVSSFGIGGTNAHVVLEEAPASTSSASGRQAQLIVLSARTNLGLETVTRNLIEFLKAHPETSFADVAYTLQTGRKVFSHRRTVLCEGREQAISALGQKDTNQVFTAEQESLSRRVVFMFSGQGSQHVNMGVQLYLHEPLFRKEVDHCAEFLISHLGVDLRDLIFPGRAENQRTAEESLLDQTKYTQPALFVFEYALAKLWMSWGVQPECMIGHSIGEYVAASLAGVFSLEEALILVAARGRLMQDQLPGAMLAVFLPEKEVERFLSPQISLAAVNSPTLCTVSGLPSAIQALCAKLTVSGVECRRVHTSHAFHSWMMDPVLDTFTDLVRQMELKPPKIPFVSNLTGTWIQASEATDPNYWARHLRSAVRFQDGVQEIIQDKSRVLLEVGPGQTLTTFARQVAGRTSGTEIHSSLPHVLDKSSDDAFVYTALGRLWLSGVHVDWAGFHTGERRNRVGLPTYPFERKRYWPEPKQAKLSVAVEAPSAGKKTDIADWFYFPVWRETPSPLKSIRTDSSEKPETYLVFQDADGIGAELTRQLRELNQNAIGVVMGTSFNKEDAGTYTIDPLKREHYWTLFDELQRSDSMPDKIVHFWSVSSLQKPLDSTSVRPSLDTSVYSLLHITQALGDQFTDPLEIITVTRGAHSIAADEIVSPESAPLLGLCKVIPQEYPSFRTLNIDLGYPSSGGGSVQRRSVDLIMREMASAGQSPVVAYRGSRRWIQEYESNRVEKSSAASKLKTESVYMITGGLGGIAVHLAEWLAKEFSAKLVLVGRSELPARNTWDQWLKDHKADDPVSAKIQRIQMLEAAGAEILVIAADVENQDQLRSAIRQARDRFGSINGVFHAAGIVEAMSLQETNLEFCERMFHAKVYGLASLAEVVRDLDMDFCMLVSSLSSILGGLGFAAYSAANSFMDAFAHRQNQQTSFPWISVNWDAWDLTDKAKTPVALPSAMNREEGIEVFRRILSSDLPCQVVISTTHLPGRLKDWIYLGRLPKQAKEKRNSSAEGVASPSLQKATADDPFRDEYERTVASIWQELLGVSAVGPKDSFFELGGHSLLATRILARIQEAFKVRLPLRTFFENPTVMGLAREIQTLIWVRQGAEVVSMVTIEKREEIEL